MHNYGAGDLLEIARRGGGETVMVPFTAAMVPTVDIAAGRVIVDPRRGCWRGLSRRTALTPPRAESMWRATVLTIFPEMFPGPLGVSLAGKASDSGIWSLDTVDIRNFAADQHRTVDDTPAGGGPGMMMKADVLGRAIDTDPHDHRPRLLMTARGMPLTQAMVANLAAGWASSSCAAASRASTSA